MNCTIIILDAIFVIISFTFLFNTYIFVHIIIVMTIIIANNANISSAKNMLNN